MRFGEGFIDPLCDFVAPELIEIGSSTGFQRSSHLEPIGLDQVKRSEEAIETGEDTQVPLSKLKVGWVIGIGVNPV